MKQSKKWMLVVLALLAVITVVLPLVGCKNDTVAEQTGGNAEQPATPGTGGGNQGSGDGNQGSGDPEQPVTYTVTFNANNGTGSMEEQPFTAGVEQELAANAFERKNYTFIGWSEDSKATSATYGDKAKFTAKKDTPLYAVWEPLWLTFTSDSDTHLKVSFDGSIKFPDGMAYSTDGENWTDFKIPNQISFGNGTDGKYVLYLRGESSWGTAQDTSNYINFTFKEGTKVHASGDIRTLVDWNDPVNANTSEARFCSLFENCTQLVTAPELKAETLATACYYSMFSGCKGLTKAPELKAETLATDCYSSMFYGCTSLKTAPELKAKTLADSCYNHMFFGCTNLASVTMLATNVGATSALNNWLQLTAGGTLTVASGMKENEKIIESLPSGIVWNVVEQPN